jgi:hypothetical protein
LSLDLERRDRMKKQKQEKKLRRLSLSRETIRSLDEPKLVEAAGGAAVICPTDSLTRPTGADGGGG